MLVLSPDTRTQSVASAPPAGPSPPGVRNRGPVRPGREVGPIGSIGPAADAGGLGEFSAWDVGKGPWT